MRILKASFSSWKGHGCSASASLDDRSTERKKERKEEREEKRRKKGALGIDGDPLSLSPGDLLPAISGEYVSILIIQPLQ